MSLQITLPNLASLSSFLSLHFLVIILTTLAIVGIEAKSTNQVECGASGQQKLELLVARTASLGPHGRDLPEKWSEVKPYCKETGQLLEKIDTNLRKCYKKNFQDIANLVIYSVKSTIRQFCRKRSKKLDLLISLMPCYNKNTRPDDSCVMRFVNETKQLIPLTDHSVKIPHVCCGYNRFLQCQEDLIDRVECLRSQKQVLMDFIRGIFQNIVDVMCGEYNETTDKCDKLGLPPKPSKRNRKHYKTFIFPLIELMDSLP